LQAYSDYVQGKQTLQQLKLKYQKSISTIRRHFAHLSHGELKEKEYDSLNIILDASCFEKDLWLLLFRANEQNIDFMIVDSEKNNYYEMMLGKLKDKCDSLSFTLDGKPGLKKLIREIFEDSPIQLCQVHFSRNIRKYTTSRPKTDSGKDLYDLAMSVTHLQEREFIDRFKEIEDRYSEFLKERNEHKQFKHKRLRSTVNAFRRDIPYLFVCQRFPYLQIENSTNSCEGYFSHLKKMVNVHPGLSPLSRIRMLISLISS